MSPLGPGPGRREDVVSALALVLDAALEDDEALNRVVVQLSGTEARLMVSHLARIAGQFLIDGSGRKDAPAVREFLSDFVGQMLVDLAHRDPGVG